MHQITRDLTIPESPVRITTLRKYTGHGCSVIRLLVFITLAIMLSRVTAYATGQQRQLDFYHTHTGENLTVVYHDGRDYIPAALEQINHFLGDFRSGDVHPMDPATLDILYRLKTELGVENTFEVISGYRPPRDECHIAQPVARRCPAKSTHGGNCHRYTPARCRHQTTAWRGWLLPGFDCVHIDSACVRSW